MSDPSYFQSLLLERGSGFHFVTTPPIDLHHTEYLMSTDSKEVMSAVLANARVGNFDVFDHLLRVMRRDDSAVTWDACTNLLSYAAPYFVIKRLLDTFHDEVYERGYGGTQWYICRILSGCKALWAVPVMLDIASFVKDRNQFDSISKYLSYLLEPERGVVADGPAIVPSEVDETQLLVNEFFTSNPAEEVVEYDEAAYRNTVLTEYSKIKESLVDGNDRRVAVFEGEQLSLEKVALKLLARLRAGGDTEEIEIGRMILEASTGINFTSFYKRNGPIQPLAAAAIVEDFLESGEADKYEPGARYFFGHRIPD